MSESPLARTSHRLPATAADAPHPAGFSRFGVLDVLSSTTPRPSGRKPGWARHLAALATKPGEKCGLAGRLRTVTPVIRNRWWIGTPLLIVVVLYVLPLAGTPAATNPNEVARIELGVAMATGTGLDIGPVAVIYGLSEDVARRSGRIYSDKAPGLSFLAAPVTLILGPLLPLIPDTDLPAFWPLRHLLTLLLVALPTAGLAFVISTCLPGTDPRRRSGLAVIIALATPLWAYATVFFGHAPAAVLVTVAWVLLLRPGVAERPPHRLHALLGGVAAGFAVTVEYPTVLLAGVIFGALIARRTPLPTLGWAAAGTIVGLVPALSYHQLAFGAPWLTGYAFKAHSGFQAIHARGVFGVSLPSLEALWGVLFSARRGLFYFSPILLLAPLGLLQMVRRRSFRDVAPLAVAITIYVFFAAGFVDWEAGWCAAARHLVPIVPLLAIPVLYALVNLGTGRWWNSLVAVLIPPQFTSPLAQLVLPSLMEGAGLHNIVSVFIGLPPIYVVIAIIAATIAALGWASSLVLRLPKRWVAAVFAAAVAAQLLWLGWQGANPSPEVEFIRAQVLRRLGHTAVASQIEGSLILAATPAGD